MQESLIKANLAPSNRINNETTYTDFYTEGLEVGKDKEWIRSWAKSWAECWTKRWAESWAEDKSEDWIEAFAEGYAEGYAEGIAEVRRRITIKMIENGYDDETISDITEISIEKIREIRKNN